MSGLTKQIIVSISEQRLTLLDAGQTVVSYSISSARNGAGEQNGSGRTPLGQHVIRLKIGGGCPAGTVFVGRRPTGEHYSRQLAENHPGRDWILTRILWLSGRQSGINRGGDVDTLRRYIYIHGCPDSEPMGTPLSHGCVRMKNSEIIDLFERIDNGTPVLIQE